jgi:hypothetical protein
MEKILKRITIFIALMVWILLFTACSEDEIKKDSSDNKFQMQAIQYSTMDSQISLSYRYDSLVYDSHGRIIKTHPKDVEGNSVPGMTYTYLTDKITGEKPSGNIKYTVNLVEGEDSVDFVSNDYFLQTAGYEKLAVYQWGSEDLLNIDITFIDGEDTYIDTRYELNFDESGNLWLVRNLIYIGGDSFVEDWVVRDIVYDDKPNLFHGQLREGIFNISPQQLLEQYSLNNATSYWLEREGEDIKHQFVYTYDDQGRVVARTFQYKNLAVVDDIESVRYRQ